MAQDNGASMVVAKAVAKAQARMAIYRNLLARRCCLPFDHLIVTNAAREAVLGVPLAAS